MKNKGFEGFSEDEIKLIENKYSEKKQRRVIMENNENNKELEEFRKFNIRDTKVLSRLLSIRSKLVCERNIDMENVIITGATGMIGAHVAKVLMERGVNVTAIIRPMSEKTGNL